MKKHYMLIVTIVLLVALVGCNSAEGAKVSKERANLNALLEDLYGSDTIVYTPKSDTIFQLTADYVNEFQHTIKAVQLNTTLQNRPVYLFLKAL